MFCAWEGSGDELSRRTELCGHEEVLAVETAHFLIHEEAVPRTECWDTRHLHAIGLTLPATQSGSEVIAVCHHFYDCSNGSTILYYAIQPQGQLWSPYSPLQGLGSVHRSHAFP